MRGRRLRGPPAAGRGHRERGGGGAGPGRGAVAAAGGRWGAAGRPRGGGRPGYPRGAVRRGGCRLLPKGERVMGKRGQRGHVPRGRRRPHGGEAEKPGNPPGAGLAPRPGTPVQSRAARAVRADSPRRGRAVPALAGSCSITTLITSPEVKGAAGLKPPWARKDVIMFSWQFSLMAECLGTPPPYPLPAPVFGFESLAMNLWVWPQWYRCRVYHTLHLFNYCVLTKHGGKVSPACVSSGCIAHECSEIRLTRVCWVPLLPSSPPQSTQCLYGLWR